MHHSASEAGGLGDSLQAVPAAIRTTVGAGLAFFGAFSLIQAWYRVMRDPHIKDKVRSAAS